VAPQAEGVVTISAVAQQGLEELKEALWRLLTERGAKPPNDTVPLP
jgi:hypothetical protein